MSIMLEDENVIIEKQNDDIETTFNLDEMTSEDRELLTADISTGWTRKRKNIEKSSVEKKICLTENTDSLVTILYYFIIKT